jgi:signal transduction histidine kinase/streptogramin lyase
MYSTADGLTASVVGSVVQDASGTIWAATPCGAIAELRGQRFVPRFTEETKDACPVALLAARDGSLWIGTARAGLFRWTGGRMKHFATRDGLSDASITALFEDREGRIWIGTERGGLHWYTDGRLSRAYGAADGVATPYLASFAQDRDGRVWIGSNANGLSVFEGGRFRTLPAAESPPTGNIAGLLVDSRGDLWIGTASQGLFRRRGGVYEAFGLEQGLGDRLVAVMLEDRGGTLWIGTTRGISRLARPQIDAVAEGRAASLDPIVVDKSDGMLNMEGSGGGFDPSGLRARDGRLWFSTINGIAVIDPESFPLNRVVPKVRVEAVTVESRPAATRPDGAFEIPAGTSSIDVAYTAFSFIAPSKVRFRYRIAGLDDKWQDVGARRTAYYTRLPPGSYAFEVMASNNDGLWNPVPASVRLAVLPLFWERRSVHTAALALLLSATGLIVFTAAHRRARRRLDEMQREQALDRERSRIARDLHDDLGSRLSHIAIMADRAATATNGTGRCIAVAARDAVRTMDELVWAVNAGNDTVESFAYYIARFAEEHVNAAGLRCRLALPPDLPARPLAADVRRHLFLACKEGVTNALKHARASEIRIRLELDGHRLVVEIRDDGQGLLPAAMDPTGHGLKNLRERMDAAGGTLTIESTPGAGTRLTFITPL